MWTVKITDQTAHSVQSDLDLHCPQKLIVLSSVRTELTEKNILLIMQSLSQMRFPTLRD